MNPPPASILVIDSLPIVRDGIVAVLSAALPEVSLASSGSFPEALDHIASTPIDLVITEFRVHGDTALTFLEKLKEERSTTRFVILSSLDEIRTGHLCIRAGASGFVKKSSPTSIVVEAVRSILAGRSFISEPLARALADGNLPHDITLRVSSLSPRELEIFTHIGGCLSVSQIAARLGLSVKTVEAHREHIKNKLALQTSSQVVAAAVRWIDESIPSI